MQNLEICVAWTSHVIDKKKPYVRVQEGGKSTLSYADLSVQ